MKRDPMATLLRVRQAALEEAQRAVADAHRCEHEAALTVRDAMDTLDLEMRAATSLAGSDETVESFARWLPIGRRNIVEAETRHQEATAVLDQARAILVLARGGVRAVEEVLDRRRALDHREQQRREQALMDEQGNRRVS